MAHKYADEATKLAEDECDTTRKAELLQIAENLKQVPARGARNLQEALQSIWMVHSALLLKGLTTASVSGVWISIFILLLKRY
jgi:pyruvate-formate lyase